MHPRINGKYEICFSWRDDQEEIFTFFLLQNTGTGIPKTCITNHKCGKYIEWSPLQEVTSKTIYN